jgi:hypothetical protein
MHPNQRGETVRVVVWSCAGTDACSTNFEPYLVGIWFSHCHSESAAVIILDAPRPFFLSITRASCRCKLPCQCHFSGAPLSVTPPSIPVGLVFDSNHTRLSNSAGSWRSLSMCAICGGTVSLAPRIACPGLLLQVG